MEKKLRELLKKKLTKKELSLVPSSYDVVGSILIFADMPKELSKKEKVIGDVLISLHKNVKTVCKKTKKFSGKYRLQKLKIIAGKKTKETIHRENNVSLKLDVEKIYFSPRSSTERKRIFEQVKNNERILVMFSGCGPYSITISKNTKAREIYSVEANPTAGKYQKENIKLNKINNIELLKGDVVKVLSKANKKFDRILMPLPKGAEDYLGIALKKIKKGIVHFYTFSKEDEYDEIIKKIKKECEKSKKKFKIIDIVKCGQFSPRVFRVCVDFEVR
tara:strand:+ start:4731 stop:5558 length:828 start_codon:yes stop_codon:yes gene_type:complete